MNNFIHTIALLALSISLSSKHISAFYNHPRGSSAPYISGDSFFAIADHIIENNYHCRPVDRIRNNFNPKKVKSGDIIYVQMDLLNMFFTKYHPRITQPYLLITHTFLYLKDQAPENYTQYFDDATLIAWFGKNVPPIHPKLHTIPLGLANKYYPHGNINIINNLRKQMPIDVRDKKLLYLNFSVPTNPERKLVRELFKDKPYCTVSKPTGYKKYMQDLAHHMFILSPPGAGQDCHRTWEALLAGSIPIIKTSFLDPLFAHLPVLIIDDWHQINEQYLHDTYQDMMSRTYDESSLFLPYWFDVIQNVVKPYKK